MRNKLPNLTKIAIGWFFDAEHPNVVSVFLNRGRKLHTTHSWEFMSLEQNGVVPSDSLFRNVRFGEDTIIGNLDTRKLLLLNNVGHWDYNDKCYHTYTKQTFFTY